MFDDCVTRLERIQTDKFAPNRWLFAKIQQQFIKNYKPGTYLTIDERLTRYRGRCSLRQYIPSIPRIHEFKPGANLGWEEGRPGTP